jgi:hypothetical protein
MGEWVMGRDSGVGFRRSVQGSECLVQRRNAAMGHGENLFSGWDRAHVLATAAARSCSAPALRAAGFVSPRPAAIR